MAWLRILEAVLGFARALADYVERKQLMDAGEAKAIASQLESSLNAVQRAKSARGVAVDKFDASNGVPDDTDPNLRD